MELNMSTTDRLLLEAKQAILNEQHRRFRELQRQEKWVEAMQQFQTTLGCAAALLAESLRLLNRTVEKHLPHPIDLPPSGKNHGL
jgi:hypothetical protein